MDDIFKPFEQADVSTTRQYGGTGLGLSITKSLVELMNGRVWVESELGKGSEFIVELAFRPAQTPIEQEIVPVSMALLKDKKVLIVDDNKDSRKIMSSYCHRAQMNVLQEAAGVDEALQWLRDAGTLPDLILSDIMMPGKDGLQFAKELRYEKKCTSIKLIGFSSAPSAGSARQSHEAGFNGYLTKPFSDDDFFKVIRTVLGDHKESKQLITRHLSDEMVFKNLKVLVAEDNPVNQRLIGIMLKNLGCQLEIVANGKEAVDKILAVEHDLCLMDVQMPVMGGVDATKEVRKNGGSSKFPIIALTAAATSEDQVACMEAGMNGYLTKPIDVMKLKESLLLWGRK